MLIIHDLNFSQTIIKYSLRKSFKIDYESPFQIPQEFDYYMGCLPTMSIFT